MPKLKPINDDTAIYARPDGSHYHLDRNCNMLKDGDFERYGYGQIKTAEIRKRRLYPCVCAYEGGRRK